MDSIQILVQEHDNILRMLDVIHHASLDILGGAVVNISDFKKIIDFIRKYADKIHHGKEEEFLFKVILDELGDLGETLIRHGMLVEHDIGRLYVSDLDTALDEYAINPTEDVKLSILVAAGSYEQLLRRHIQKENDVIFPFGEKKISQNSAQWIEAQTMDFEENSENVLEHKRQLEALVALENKYNS